MDLRVVVEPPQSVPRRYRALASECLRTGILGAPTKSHYRSALRRSISTCPRRMEHQSLCSATGMPHSTQIRTRCMGAGAFDEKSRLRNDIPGLQGTVTLSVRNEPRPGYTRPDRIGRAGYTG